MGQYVPGTKHRNTLMATLKLGCNNPSSNDLAEGEQAERTRFLQN